MAAMYFLNSLSSALLGSSLPFQGKFVKEIGCLDFKKAVHIYFNKIAGLK